MTSNDPTVEELMLKHGTAAPSSAKYKTVAQTATGSGSTLPEHAAANDAVHVRFTFVHSTVTSDCREMTPSVLPTRPRAQVSDTKSKEGLPSG